MSRRLMNLLIVTFLVAVAINFIWEMTQAVLFVPMGGWTNGWMDGTRRCFVASLGDGVIVLSIAAIGWLLFQRGDWIVRPGVRGYVLMATVGIAIAVLIERYALATARWAYTEHMPILPLVDVGLVPVLQMVILPAVVFWVAVRLLNKGHGTIATP